MSDESTLADCGAKIDRRLEAAFEPLDGARIPVARATMEGDDDRWYGELLVRANASVTGSVDDGSVLPAAAAVELLGGYCRLRSELLVELADDAANSVPPDPSRALLAGDYLYSAAYAALGDVDDPARGACFETLTRVSSRIVATFGRSSGQSMAAQADFRTLVDGTAGTLGEGAALLGATLAGVDDAHRDGFATLGRGLGTARQLRRTLASEPGSVRIPAPRSDDPTLRRHAERRVAEAEDALRELSAVADVTRLRPLFADVEEE